MLQQLGSPIWRADGHSNIMALTHGLRPSCDYSTSYTNNFTVTFLTLKMACHISVDATFTGVISKFQKRFITCNVYDNTKGQTVAQHSTYFLSHSASNIVATIIMGLSINKCEI
jgi:hypothetical protein